MKRLTNRRQFLKAAGLGATALAIPGCTNTSPNTTTQGTQRIPDNRTNILILMTDQQRFDSLSCYGCKAIETPNLDRLAKEGALFEHCYSPCPICTPSRASMLTGKPVPGHGVYKLHDILPDDQILLPKRLQESGYQTAMIGKLHVSGLWHEAEKRHPNDGFDQYHWCIDPGLNFDSKFNAFARWVERKDPVFYERLKKEGKSLHHFPAELHFSRWASETTVDFIENRDNNRPFFALMSLFDPHDPYFDHPPEAADLVSEQNIPEPEPLSADKDMPNGIRREVEKSRIIKTQSKTFKGSIHDLRKGYYASIAFLDKEMGKVLDCLDEQHLTENTMVIFLSDHGDMLFDRGLFTKGGFFYDPSVRVPFLMRLPGKVPAGTRVKGPIQQFDVAATALSAAKFNKKDLADIMPDSMDLVSLVNKGKAYENYRDYAICMYRNTGYGPGHKYYDPPIHATMFRDENFKLNIYHNDPDETKGELYDMRRDPKERRNLWNDPQYAQTKMRLYQRLFDWMVRHDVRYLGTRGGEKFKTLKKNYYGDQKK